MVLVGASLALGACGGTVVFEEAGSGGGAGGGAGAGGGSGDLGSACPDYCAARRELGCDETSIADCERFCEIARAYAGRCVDLADEALRCATPSSGRACVLEPQDVCPGVAHDYEACVYPPGDCEVGEFRTTGPDVTEGGRTCGSVFYGSRCEGNFIDSESVACTCLVDGDEVGTCDDEVSAFGSCCGVFFAERSR